MYTNVSPPCPAGRWYPVLVPIPSHTFLYPQFPTTHNPDLTPWGKGGVPRLSPPLQTTPGED